MERAKAYYHKSINVLVESENYWELGSTRLSFAQLLYQASNYEAAEEILLKNLSLCESIGYSKYVSDSWFVIGKIRTYQERFDEAELAYNNGLNQSENLSPEHRETANYIGLYGLGRLELRRGNYQIALEFLNKSLEIRQSIGHLDGIHFVLLKLAQTLIGLQKPTDALQMLEESMRIAKMNKYPQMQEFLKQVKEIEGEIL